MTLELRPYPAYKDSGVPWLGQVPEHWDLSRARYLFREVDERTLDAALPHLSMSQQYGLIDSSRLDHRRLQSGNYDAGKVCRTGDLVLNRLKAHLGVFAHASQDGLISPDYSVFRPLTRHDVRFFELLLKGPLYRAELRRRTKGIVEGFWRLYSDDFYDLRIPVPPLDEHSRILDWVDRYEILVRRSITNKQRLIALLNEQKQAIINRAVTRGLDPDVPLKPSGIDWLGDVPAHWELSPIKRALVQLIDTEHKTAPAVDSGRYLVVRTSNIRNGQLVLENAYFTDEGSFEEWTRRGVPQPGDILFTREAPAGEACIVPSAIDLCMGQRVVLMRPDRQRVAPKFLLLQIQYGAIRRFITLKSQGSTVPHFNMSDIAAMPMLLPPRDEQELIVSATEHRLVDIEASVERIRHEMQLIREYRTRLIADVVTGKVDVRGVDFAVEGANDFFVQAGITVEALPLDEDVSPEGPEERYAELLTE